MLHAQKWKKLQVEAESCWSLQQASKTAFRPEFQGLRGWETWEEHHQITQVPGQVQKTDFAYQSQAILEIEGSTQSRAK